MRTPITVAVIDDDPVVLQCLQPALEKAGYRVAAFGSSVEALERIGEGSFNIVISEVRTDKVDGFEILDHVTSKHQHTRVILISGYATIETAREAFVKGAFDFIAKPFKPNELLKSIEKAIVASNDEFKD